MSDQSTEFELTYTPTMTELLETAAVMGIDVITLSVWGHGDADAEDFKVLALAIDRGVKDEEGRDCFAVLEMTAADGPRYIDKTWNIDEAREKFATEYQNLSR